MTCSGIFPIYTRGPLFFIFGDGLSAGRVPANKRQGEKKNQLNTKKNLHYAEVDLWG